MRPLLTTFLLCLAAQAAWAGAGTRIVEASGVRGGLIVHAGCGDGKLTAELRLGDRWRFMRP